MGPNSHSNESGDEYGDIGDEDLLFAEFAATDSSSPHLKRSSPAHFGSGPPAKKHSANFAISDPKAVDLARRILKETWGFSGFRLKQEMAISRLIEGASAAVIFPTGGGKSLVYQIPALAFDEYDDLCGQQKGGGITLVVSPLIALMKDQTDALKKRGIAAATLDSTQGRDAWVDTHHKLRSGELKLLYVAPERLNNEGFMQMIQATKIRLIAIDEAHCISQWGHAFRPDYLKIARFAKEIRAERVLCLTATATPQVAADICAAFDIDSEAVFRTASYRSNLRLLAETHISEETKTSALVSFLRANKGASVVYVQTHKQTEVVRANLKTAGFNAYEYHAGMSNESRTAIQDRFLGSKNIIIVATIAFGMGIDKPDIRNIVHYAIPKSLEGYSQEIGRAGRDGLPSTCMMYLCEDDLALIEQWSRADVPSLKSIQGLVGGLFEEHQDVRVGEVIERNLNHESGDWDIRRNALDNVNAQLELRFELIRAITPKYSQYKYKKSPGFDSSVSDGTKVTTALKTTSKTAKVWTNIDVDLAARNGGFERGLAVRKLQDWHDGGLIELQPSGVINRFRITKEFPKDDKARDCIVATLQERIEERERDDMARIQQVIDLIVASRCISRGLAEHFGDAECVPGAGCGHCCFCETKKPVDFSRTKHLNLKGRIDAAKFHAVLAATEIRDDPRFLARVAFGIGSPRITAEKLSKHEVFGSMEHCDFDELLDKFAQVCK